MMFQKPMFLGVIASLISVCGLAQASDERGAPLSNSAETVVAQAGDGPYKGRSLPPTKPHQAEDEDGHKRPSDAADRTKIPDAKDVSSANKVAQPDSSVKQ